MKSPLPSRSRPFPLPWRGGTCSVSYTHLYAGGGKRASGSGPNPLQVGGLIVTLVLIIAAAAIVFKYVSPLLFGGKTVDSSVSTSQTDGQSSVGSGDNSQTQVTVNSLTLSRTEACLLYTSYKPERQKYLYSIDMEIIDDRYFWMSCDYDDAVRFRDYVINKETGEKEPNPRSKEQIEPRQQFFACYD